MGAYLKASLRTKVTEFVVESYLQRFCLEENQRRSCDREVEPERTGLVAVTFSPKERPQHSYWTLHGGI